MLANDDAFTALAHVQRRQLLLNVLHRDPQPVPELSTKGEELLDAHDALLRQFLSGSRSSATVDTALVRLYHVHLPMLAEFGFIRWHRDAHVVTKGPNFDDLIPLLELIDSHREAPPATRIGVPP